MAPISTFSRAFSWMKTFKFQIKYNWKMFLIVWLATVCSDNGLTPSRLQAHILSNDGPLCGRIYASLGLSELKAITCHWFIVRWYLKIAMPTGVRFALDHFFYQSILQTNRCNCRAILPKHSLTSHKLLKISCLSVMTQQLESII